MKPSVSILLLSASLLLLTGCLNRPPHQSLTRPVDLQAAVPTTPTLAVAADSASSAETVAEPSIFTSENGQPPPNLSAEGTLDLSVELAVLTAISRNRALAVELYAPIIAGTFVETERAVFDPVLFAEAGLDTSRDRAYDTATDRFFSIDGDQLTIRGGVAKRFITGTDVTMDLRHTYNRRDNTQTTDDTRLGLNLTQALLRDAGMAVNLAGIRRAEAAELASAYSVRGFAEHLVATVEEAYWDYALALRQVEIFEESLTLARRQRDDIHTRISVGQIAETEEIVANAELALREQQLIDARSARERARLSLLRLLNPPAADGWDRQISLNEEIIVPEISLGSALDHEALAVRLRPDLNEARLQARRGELETVQTANGLLPRLDLFINLGKTGYARSFGGSIEDLDGTGYDAAIGLGFELPVENRAARALDRRARAGYRQALDSVENLKQLISLEVRVALLEVERNRQQIEASAARRILQEEVLRTETVRFRVGTATALDVARVQRDLLESRINEVAAIVHYRQALINLYLLDGTLLLRRGIQGPGAAEVVIH